MNFRMLGGLDIERERKCLTKNLACFIFTCQYKYSHLAKVTYTEYSNNTYL